MVRGPRRHRPRPATRPGLGLCGPRARRHRPQPATRPQYGPSSAVRHMRLEHATLCRGGRIAGRNQSRRMWRGGDSGAVMTPCQPERARASRGGGENPASHRLGEGGSGPKCKLFTVVTLMRFIHSRPLHGSVTKEGHPKMFCNVVFIEHGVPGSSHGVWPDKHCQGRYAAAKTLISKQKAAAVTSCAQAACPSPRLLERACIRMLNAQNTII